MPVYIVQVFKNTAYMHLSYLYGPSQPEGAVKLTGRYKRSITMKRTIFSSLVFASMLVLFIRFSSPADTAPVPEENTVMKLSCPKIVCQSSITINTNAPNCQGVYCGPTGTHNITTDGNGDVTLNCMCAGTYTFCFSCSGGGTYQVTVDGSATSFYDDTPSGLCPCGDQ
jgi:hypothetical protein